MIELEKKYNRVCVTPSDINQHLPTLYKYGKNCEHITEFGVRTGVSTWALLYAKPKKLLSYDIEEESFLDKDDVISISESIGVNYNFSVGDTLKIEIDQTDLLFIDTLHTYNQLSLELKRHHTKVNKYIIFHDTTTFGTTDEIMYDHVSEDVKNLNIIKRGVRNALIDFLDVNSDWEIVEEFTNNNGLTIIKNNKNV